MAARTARKAGERRAARRVGNPIRDLSPLAWVAALGGLGLFLIGKDARPMPAAGPTTVPLLAGTGYLFIVRLAPETLEDAARAILESKAATMIEFAPASIAPFWARTGEPWSERLVSFKAVPAGNSTVMLGDDFYGIGRLERVVRL